MGVKTFRDLRAWQSARTFKLAVYRLTEAGALSRDFRLRDQLRESAASAVSQIVEGFGRFSPADFARFLAIGKASLMESQNHLEDAVDRGHITDDDRAECDRLAQLALRDVSASRVLAIAKGQGQRSPCAGDSPGAPNTEPRT